jgi:hypothetical protein
MEVSETLKKAWAAVEEARLPEVIHVVAFKEAVRLLTPSERIAPPHVESSRTGRTSTNRAASGGATHSGDDSNDAVGPFVTEEEMYDRVVQQTSVDRNKLELIVHLDDDGPRVSLAGLKLGRNNAERARAVAQILCLTRSFGLGESETSLEIIRSECDRLRVYDPANFSSHMKALTGFVINGAGPTRRLRAKGPGIAAFSALVDNLLGGE